MPNPPAHRPPAYWNDLTDEERAAVMANGPVPWDYDSDAEFAEAEAAFQARRAAEQAAEEEAHRVPPAPYPPAQSGKAAPGKTLSGKTPSGKTKPSKTSPAKTHSRAAPPGTDSAAPPAPASDIPAAASSHVSSPAASPPHAPSPAAAPSGAASPPPDATTPTRADGWTAARQRSFLESLAEGHSVEAACRIVGMTHQSAYNFRRRATGTAFALGWDAALLLARQKLADTLMVRAIEGQTETITRANGDVVERHRYDNRLATAMLTRLDRLADAQAREGTHQAARMVAQEFDAFLSVLDSDSPARAALFLYGRAEANAAGVTPDLAPVVALARADRFVRTGAAMAAEVDISDLDVDRRKDWTGEQWQRAEASGLVRIAPEPEPEPETDEDDDDGNPQLPQLPNAVRAALGLECDDEIWKEPAIWRGAGPRDEPVWRDAKADEWRTRFPPPPGFDGEEFGEYWYHLDYERTLTDEEMAVLEAGVDAQIAAQREQDEALRAKWMKTPWFETLID
ncbi:hypothetical protein KFK14_20245 [Sphingobium phenoxybenzoativorans]|uniref:Uncharacterized protein n=1 Tax=Sphingobium phenoxybenzoativorans TaxID=1592790 RepID=A0A975K742_9SPHN|nr:hypothetical protein [Sphingobium phenoxybenzoativorans]QUT05298.1 hypothetical protein KFK14_20245 [Sphingobium phenoxybenzoativorans]